MKIKHLFCTSCLAISLAIGGYMHADAIFYFNNDTNYPMLNTGNRKSGTHLFMDVNSTVVTNVTKNDIQVAVNLLHIRNDLIVDTNTTYFKLAVGGKNYVLDATDKWYLLPKNTANPLTLAAVLIREDMASSTHREKYEKEISEIIYNKQQKKAKQSKKNVVTTSEKKEHTDKKVTTNKKQVTEKKTESKKKEEQGTLPKDKKENIKQQKPEEDTIQVKIESVPVVHITTRE